MSSQHGFPITRPISVWNKPLKANFKDLFKALGKAVINGTTGKWGDTAKDLVDAAAAIGLKEDYAQVAWLLIYNAITQAIFTLVDEHKDYFLNPPDEKNLEMLCEALDWSLEKSDICIDSGLFERPKELPVVETIKTPFASWLTQGFEMKEAHARSMTNRLPSYFVFALNEQWRKHPTRYSILKDAVETPFTRASKKEQEWLYYRSWLQKQAEEQVFGETFSLRQIYIPLRAYYKKASEDNHEMAIEQERKEKKENIVVDLTHELEQWLQLKDNRDAIRLISGGPGCGKSSFAKMFAAHQAERNDLPVIFIPLHQLEITDDLIKAVDEFMRYDRFFSYNPLNPETGEPRLLIIFDGLDELAMQGRVGAETAQYFIREVQKKVDVFNMRETRLQILISGRELAIQTNIHEFRKPGQILHILPYFLTKEERNNYIDPQGLLKKDQRHQWWENYGKASGQGYADMPEVLRKANLKEITAQPLLNYLLALSYIRGKIDFSTTTNLNAIYGDLLRAVYERGWAGHRHAAIRDLTEAQFIQILEEIAIAAWHGEGRTTTVKELQNHCEQSGLKRLMATFEEGVSQGLSRLFLAFYFRQAGHRQGGDKTFEFTHKSFGEYLTARRIVRGVKRMHNELQRHQEDFDSGQDERDVLSFWAKLCGQTPMDYYLFRFICDEMLLQSKDKVEQWQQSLCQLFGFMLRNGMPMERLQLRSFKEETYWARNAEEGLLAMLNSCASITKIISKFYQPSSKTFGAWIGRIQGQRSGDENCLALRCLSFLNLCGCILDIRDFYDANFFMGNLQMAHLYFTTFSHAILVGANLKWAILKGAILKGANLEGANLEGAILKGTILEGAIWINGKRLTKKELEVLTDR